jgi:hypothetical protein
LRRKGRLPYRYLTDNTRYYIRPNSFNNPAEAIKRTAKFYRKALWDEADEYVEMWLEKDALAGVVSPITEQYDVPLWVSRGYASLSFLYTAAEDMREDGRPVSIYHLGDYDPSGVDAARKIEKSLREFAPDVEITFTRLAVLPKQIRDWNLPSRPNKATDTRTAGFEGEASVELDAIEPQQLRDLVENALDRHLPKRELDVLKVAEESERDYLKMLAGQM